MSDIENPQRNEQDFDEEKIEEPTKIEDDKDGKKCRGCGKKGNNNKKVSFFRLRRGKKNLQNRKRKKKGFLVNSSGSSLWGGCFLCLRQHPRAADYSSGESPTSDPNSSEFTFDMLRALIENNEFWSEDCNTHLDTDV